MIGLVEGRDHGLRKRFIIAPGRASILSALARPISSDSGG